MEPAYLTLFVPAAVFVAVLTQSISGFGVALVAMGLLAGPLGVRGASALVALTAALLSVLLLAWHRKAFRWRSVWRLLLGAAVGTPFGLLVQHAAPERLILGAFGLLLMAYALYALARPSLPRLAGSGWAYLSGMAGGVLSGAYNASGPPVIVYGSTQDWSPPEFKSNLQSFFLFNHLLVLFGHGLSGHYTPDVWRNFALAVPALAAGLALGLLLERVIPAEIFRKIVLGLLFLVGLRLLLP